LWGCLLGHQGAVGVELEEDIGVALFPVIPFSSPQEPRVEEQGLEDPASLVLGKGGEHPLKEVSRRVILIRQETSYMVDGRLDLGVHGDLLTPVGQIYKSIN